MATNNPQKERETNPFLQEITDNLGRFLENINCLRDSYMLYGEQALSTQEKKAAKHFDDLVKTFPVNEETGEHDIPVRQYREYQKRKRLKERAERAKTLVPQAYLVSLVSLYDQFYAGLIRLIYRIAPNKLKENNKPYTYKDLCDLQTLQEWKVVIVDETIEDRLRDSHIKQFEWLAGAMGIDTLKAFKEWPDFVELTERRNLFVHSDGVVSQQYIDMCGSVKALNKDITKGCKLPVDREYFEKAYKILYIVGVKLTQMLAHTVYKKQYPGEGAAIDKLLINNVYEAIEEELYDVAISVSDFALSNPHFKHNANDRCYILLNYAQAFKWSGATDKCQELLDKEDCTVWKPELLIPKYTLEGEYEKVYEKMRLIGNNNEELTPEHYRQWPIFKEIRKEKEFAKVFKEIFDEELETNIQIKMDVRPHFFSKDGNVMVHSKDGGSFFFFFTDEDDKDVLP